MNDCKVCNNIKYLETQNPGDYCDVEDGIYKSDNGNYYWFSNCDDCWYSGFVHQVIYCPICGRKIK